MNPILESCKKDIAVKHGYTDWDDLLEGISESELDVLKSLDLIIDELTDLYVKRLKIA